jgi:hypothetical protein
MKNTKDPNKLPIETIRFYAERIAEKITTLDQSFTKQDEILIFFPNEILTRYENHRVIITLRQIVIFIIQSVFNDFVSREDIVLIFRYQHLNAMRCAIVYFKKNKLSKYINLIEKIIDEIQKDDSFWKPDPNAGKVSVLVHSDKKIISAMIPIEQLEYAQKVFLVIEQETSFSKKAVLQKNQSFKMSMIRYGIVYILFRKFPDASTLFLADSIKRDRTRVLSILNTIRNRYLSTVLKEQEDVKEFWSLVNKIKSKLNS